MHSYVTFMFPYINLVLRVFSHPSSLSLCRDGWERILGTRSSLCYSMLLVCIHHVPVCIRVVLESRSQRDQFCCGRFEPKSHLG